MKISIRQEREQQGGAVSQNVKLPALHLTNAQREQVRKAVLSNHKDVEFQLAETKSAKILSPKSARRCRKVSFRTAFRIQS
jgi:hypothetical protein